MLIPKHREYDYTEAKAYPISLKSFLLNTVEKLMDKCVTDSLLKEHLLHRNNLPTRLENSQKLYFTMW
jgi:hypothetical protein